MKEWKVKYCPQIFGSLFEGGFGAKPSWKFWRDWKYFDTETKAIENIKKTIPHNGMIGVIGCAYLYRKVGIKWVFVEHFKWKKRYEYKNGEQVSYCTNVLESWSSDGSPKPLNLN